MRRGANRGGASGFSLVELLVVVVIIGILSAIAVPLYLRTRYRSQAIEAGEVLSRVGAAQESYRAEFGVYSDVSNDLPLAGGSPGSTGTLGTWWPAEGLTTGGRQTDFYAGLPASWNQLGVRPRQLVRYSYQTIAGRAGVRPNLAAPSNDLGYASLPTPQQGVWYFATATSDLDGDGIRSRFELSNLTRRLTIVGSDIE